MDAKTAEVFVKDVLFNFTFTSIPYHFWGLVSLKDFGLSQESCGKLEEDLGLNPGRIDLVMTPRALSILVEKESPLDVKVETVPFFAWF